MSKENRKKEYDRLISLGRERDIPESLVKEFGEIKKDEKKESKFQEIKSKLTNKK